MLSTDQITEIAPNVRTIAELPSNLGTFEWIGMIVYTRLFMQIIEEFNLQKKIEFRSLNHSRVFFFEFGPS